ncbi:hypothetical protein JHN45_18960 [Streptomyces sp. MBT53]|nr:hypothetical protein [Streptomyces sp. MBT53]
MTNVEATALVDVRFGSEFSLSGVTQQDVVDAVRAVFSALPNVTVSATQYEVTSSTV